MSASQEAYASAGLAEMHAALAMGRKVHGWQYGARIRCVSVERAPPGTDEGWLYCGTSGGGLRVYFTVFEIEGDIAPSAEAEARRWLEGVVAGGGSRAEQNHAARILSMLPLRVPRSPHPPNG